MISISQSHIMDLKQSTALGEYAPPKTTTVQKNYSFPENYPIIQHTDVTLNTNKKELFIQSDHDAN